MLSILFYIRKKGTSDPTMATIYLRITVNGKRAEVSTMRKVQLSKWNAKANKVIVDLQQKSGHLVKSHAATF